MAILSTREAVDYLNGRVAEPGKRRKYSEDRLRAAAKAGEAPVWMRDQRGYLFTTEQLDSWLARESAA